jgi:hypothetical protein
MQAARKGAPPSLPKPLGPLSGNLTRAGKTKDKEKAVLVDQNRDAPGNHTQDAVVPELQATGEQQHLCFIIACAQGDILVLRTIWTNSAHVYQPHMPSNPPLMSISCQPGFAD